MFSLNYVQIRIGVDSGIIFGYQPAQKVPNPRIQIQKVTIYVKKPIKYINPQ
jgi:hypothetical protein